MIRPTPWVGPGGPPASAARGCRLFRSHQSVGRAQSWRCSPQQQMGNVYYKWEVSSQWSAWDGYIGNPGVQIVSQPAIGFENGSWLVFATGADGNVYYKWLTLTSQTGWSVWDSAIGSPGVQIASMPAVGYQNGSWLVYATGMDGNVYYKWSTSTGWSGWDGAVNSPNVQIVTPPSIGYQSGSWLVFATAADGNVYYKWSTPTGWSVWDGAIGNPGIQIESPPSVGYQNGSWLVYATGSDGNVYYNWSISTGWAGWDSAVGSGNTGRGLAPTAPVKEYLYFNGRVIAVENGA